MTDRPMPDVDPQQRLYGELHERLSREHAAPVPDQRVIDDLIRQLDDLQGRLKADDGQPGNNPVSNPSNPK